MGKDLQTVLICRFFAGMFGSCPLAVVAAVFADMYNNKLCGLVITVFCTCVFMGPLLAPFIGGFIVTSYLGWRWTEYISGIMGFSRFALLVLFMEETYPPVVLMIKAEELRRRTKNWGIHAKQEEIEVDLRELIVRNISRPLRILFTEPIVLLLTIYMSFVCEYFHPLLSLAYLHLTPIMGLTFTDGLLYLFLTAYALVFEGKYHFSLSVSGLTYIGMVVGELIVFTIVFYTNGSYVKKLEANNNIPVPEWRLPLAMLGGPIFAGTRLPSHLSVCSDIMT